MADLYILQISFQFANHIKKSEAGVKGSKLKKVELKISIDSIKVEDVKMKVQCIRINTFQI